MKQSIPYLIAEIGVNFFDTAKVLNVSPLEAAMLYIDGVAASGSDCAKFQSYKAETIVSKHSPAYWDLRKEPTETQYELFKKHDSFGESEFIQLSQYAHGKGLDFTSTPFDYASADYLAEHIDFFKISSSDVSNIPFIEHVASKGLPIVLSVGASYLSEVDEAVRALQRGGCEDITLLHCVLSYPTAEEDANLRVITSLKSFFPDLKVGYSDHVAPDSSMTTLTAAYLLGAEVIEKHFTLDKSLQGNDHYHAGDVDDFRTAVANLRHVDRVLGSAHKTVFECEFTPRREARRSLVLTRSLLAGDVISSEDVMAKRPGTGIQPSMIDAVVGRRVARDAEEDTVLTWDLFY